MSTTGIPLELLEKFTYKGIPREALAIVHHDGAFAWATDGLIMVRAPSTFPETEDFKEMRAKFQTLLDEGRASDDSPNWTSELPVGEAETEKCEICGGTGKASKCPSCEGTGGIDFDHSWTDRTGKSRLSFYSCECEECDGAGYSRGGDDDCEDCQGTGKIEHDTRLAFGDVYLNAVIVKRLRELPGLQIHHTTSDKKYRQLALRGDGWIGCVMPMRGPEDE